MRPAQNQGKGMFGSETSWAPDELERVPACPVCGTVERVVIQSGIRDWAFGAAPGQWTLHQCVHCGAAYLDPRLTPDSIHLAYRNYYTHAAPNHAPSGVVQKLRRLVANSYRTREFKAEFMPAIPGGWLLFKLFPADARMLQMDGRGLTAIQSGDKRVLDVGCGNGRFLSFARALGWEASGVEMDPLAAATARAQGFKILASRVEELTGAMSGMFDAVTLSHVLEHVHDPVKLLMDCHSLLKPGGFLWLETPNIASVGYDLYGRFWRGLEAPRHLVLFSRSSLELCLRNAGFERFSILRPRDVALSMFSLSAALEEGQIVEVERRALSREAVNRLKKNVALAKKIVRLDSDRTEFIAVQAHRT